MSYKLIAKIRTDSFRRIIFFKEAEEIMQIVGDLDLRFNATYGGSGVTPGRGVVVPFSPSIATFVVFGNMSIVCNATRGAAGGLRWSEH